MKNNIWFIIVFGLLYSVYSILIYKIHFINIYLKLRFCKNNIT